MNNNLQIFLRNFQKHKTTNILSIIGLSLGISIALLLGWWSINELSYDNFNHDGAKIFRICREGFINNETIKVGTVFSPLASDANEKFPEIEESVRVTTMGKQRVKVDEKVNYEKNIYLADSNFFTFFDYAIKTGNPKTCLNAPNSIVITENLAKKYFANNDPIGKTINVFGKDWQVSAVMCNVPVNSHLQFDAMAALAGLPFMDKSGWGNRDMFSSYFKIAPNTNTKQLASKITQMAIESFPPYKQVNIKHFLQPLKNIHFSTERFRFDFAVKSDKRFVMIFIFMAIAILAIACINFTNLFISTSFLRAKAIGVKKTNGAGKATLIKEFFMETSFFVLISVIIGVGLAVLFLPSFNHLANSNISFDYSNFTFYLYLLAIAVITILMAGTFPAFYITKFNPATTLKGKFDGKNISGLQKGLVILQFAASIILLITVVTIKKQIHFIQKADLGFNISNIVYLDATGPFASSYNTIKEELERNPAIVEVTAKNCLPSDWNNGNPVATPDNLDNPYIMEVCQIKENYLDMMKIKVSEGENISKFHDSPNYAMINKQAAKVLGLDDPIGKEIIRNDQHLIVKGVIDDIKSKSLHTAVDPQVYLSMNNVNESCVLLIKITDDAKAAINAIREKWEAGNPDYPFEYHFLDKTYDELYQTEKRAGKIVTWGMFIALLITMIGLFAMARYSTERRTKEIGVRQVNGAKIYDIIILLNRDFLKWVFIAFVVALPISFFVVKGWLNNFAFHTSLSWWVFALAGIASLIIALITVSWQVISAARKNPVEALRYE